MSDKNQGLYSTEIIANLLNISARRVEQLTQKKIIPKAGRGVYDLGSTVQSYIRYLQGICSGAIKSGEPSELDKRLLEAKVLERESKARQAKYRADAMEQNVKRIKLHDLRAKIENLPDEAMKCLHEAFSFTTYERVIIRRTLEDLTSKILESCDDC